MNPRLPILAVILMLAVYLYLDMLATVRAIEITNRPTVKMLMTSTPHAAVSASIAPPPPIPPPDLGGDFDLALPDGSHIVASNTVYGDWSVLNLLASNSIPSLVATNLYGYGPLWVMTPEQWVALGRLREARQ